MSESTVGERLAHRWYARPVLFVSDIQAALRFYIDRLGFKKKWQAGDGTVCQVDRGGCEIDELRREMSERSVPAQKPWWGYDAIRIADPDGNELLFPLDETNDGGRQT